MRLQIRRPVGARQLIAVLFVLSVFAILPCQAGADTNPPPGQVEPGQILSFSVALGSGTPCPSCVPPGLSLATCDAAHTQWTWVVRAADGEPFSTFDYPLDGSFLSDPGTLHFGAVLADGPGANGTLLDIWTRNQTTGQFSINWGVKAFCYHPDTDSRTEIYVEGGQFGPYSWDFTPGGGGGGGGPPPNPAADFSWALSPSDGRKINFDGAMTNDVADSYAWDFGDGTGGSGQTPTHVYARFGQRYDVRLTVRDTTGRMYSATHTITTGSCTQPSLTVDVGAVRNLRLGQALVPKPTVREQPIGCGRPAFRWSVAAEPKDPWPGVAVITAPQAPSPTLRFSEAGTYSLRLRVSDGTSSATKVLRVAVKGSTFSFSALVGNAEHALAEARHRHLHTTAYYKQILNIVCAAAKDPRAGCGAMRSAYRLAEGATHNWAREWIWSVFETFLGRSPEVEDIPPPVNEKLRRAVCEAAASYLHVVDKRFCLSELSNDNFATLLVGADHFFEHLWPAFANTIPARLKGSLRRAGFKTVTSPQAQRVVCASVKWIETEHNSLFRYAVDPGFAELARTGQLDFIASTLARIGVPAYARAIRTHDIDQALSALGAKRCGQ